ncbi:MAG: hypothetical protein ABWK01_00660 [Infirmifilum sp.]
MGLKENASVAFAITLTLLALVSFPVQAAPTYISQHFQVYDSAGAGATYSQSVASALESALNTLQQQGVRLAPPCSGYLYTVNITSLPSGEGGYTSWQYSYDTTTGKIQNSCILGIMVASGLSGSTLTHVAYHEMNHVAQVAYITYKIIIDSYPWYIEANAEGIAGALLKSCGFEPYYFQASLYSKNPYSFSGAAAQCYGLGAFYNWLVSSGYATMASAFSNSFSGSTVISDWINSAYIRFLISLARGVQMCGTTYQPAFQEVTLSTKGWSTQVSLEGLSASYFKLNMPSPGVVSISVSGSPISNLLLNKSFYTSNTTLLFALVNPSTSQATYQVTVSYAPPLQAEIRGGVFHPASGQLELSLYVSYAGSPVSGSIKVNGSSVQASSGQAAIALQDITWRAYTLIVEYSGESTTVFLSLQRPSAALLTQAPLYVTPTAYGAITVKVTNPNQVAVQASVKILPPVVNNQSIFEFTSYPQDLTLPSGDSIINIGFKAAGQPGASTGTVILELAPSDEIDLPFPVRPASLKILEAVYSSVNKTTSLKVEIQPISTWVRVRIPGLSGETPVPLSTYYVGVVRVSLPGYQIALSAAPLLVAPKWVLANVTATLSTVESCPDYPVSFYVQTWVNASYLGGVSFSCSSHAQISSLLNLSATALGRATLVANNNPSWTATLQVTPPVIQWKLLEWRVTDNGSLVTMLVNVSGPHTYLVLNEKVANGSITVRKALAKPQTSLEVDTGFKVLVVEMPKISLKIKAPEVVIYPGTIPVTLVFNTSAYLDASFDILLDSHKIMTVKAAGSGEQEASISLKPDTPGEHIVSVKSWFTENSSKVYYVQVKQVKISSDPFRLIGEKASVSIVVSASPPLPLPVNVSLAGCEMRTLKVRGNSTLTLGYNHPCTLTIKANLLNLSDSSQLRWDTLNLKLEEVLGWIGASPLVAAGAVRGAAFFSNGSRVPAEVLVNGLERYTVSSLGEYAFNLTVQYLGSRNSTLVKAYLVPRDLYLGLLKAAENLGSPPSLEKKLQLAVLTGRWDEVATALEVYNNTSMLGGRDPIAALAYWFLRRWSEEGNPGDLNLAVWLVQNRLWLYVAAAATTGLFLCRRYLGRSIRRSSHLSASGGS